MRLPASIRPSIALTLLLITPAAFADVGPDAGDFMLALLAWLPFVGLCIWVAPTQRQWVAGSAALLGYPYAWLAFGAFAHSVVDDHYAASRVVLWALLVAALVFIAWLLLLRWLDQGNAKGPHKSLALDLAVVLLVVPALAIAIAPLELTPLPDSLAQHAGTIVPLLVFVSLLAALGLRRQWFGAWWLAGAMVVVRVVAECVRLVKLPGLFQIGAHAGEAQIGMLLLLVPAMIVLQFGVTGIQLALGGLLLHPAVRNPAKSEADSAHAPKFKTRLSGAFALTVIVLLTIAATPKVRQISVLLAQNAIYRHQLDKNERIRLDNIADMQRRASKAAAAVFDALPQQDELPFATLSATDVGAFVATTASADCDVRIWPKGDANGWNQPRIVWRLSLIDINADRLKLDVSAMAHGLDGTRLRYADYEQHMPPRVDEIDSMHRVFELSRNTLHNAIDLEYGNSLFLMMGAAQMLGETAYNNGTDYEHAEARHVAAYSFGFYPSWSEADRDLFRQPATYSFDLATDDLRIEQPMEWRQWIVIRSDDSVLVAINNPPALEARLADATQMPALRKLLSQNYYGVSEGGADIRLAGLRRLSATITDLSLQKRQIDLLQKKMLTTLLVTRIEDNNDESDRSSFDLRSRYRDAPLLHIGAVCTESAPAHLREVVQQIIRK